MRLKTMKRCALALLMLMGVSACASGGANPVVDAARPSITAPSTTLVDLEEWCATQTPDRCIEGMVYLDWNPGQEHCVFLSSDPETPFRELCDQPGSEVQSVTTVPTEQSETQQRSAEQDYQDEVTGRLPGQDERASSLLTSIHGAGIVTVGLVFTKPVGLNEAEVLADEVGAALISAWRTDYVCFPGIDDWPVPTASRFAYLDGVERAERSREEMEKSTTPVTGAHIPLNAFAVMEQEARALREPGVLIEAVRAEIPVAALEDLRNDPRVARVRIADFPIEWLDLSDQSIPVCEG